MNGSASMRIGEAECCIDHWQLTSPFLRSGIDRSPTSRLAQLELTFDSSKDVTSTAFCLPSILESADAASVAF